jgi:hypothetical protein
MDEVTTVIGNKSNQPQKKQNQNNAIHRAPMVTGKTLTQPLVRDCASTSVEPGGAQKFLLAPV